MPVLGSQANSAWLHYRAEEWQQAQDQLEKALANWEGAVYPIKWPGHWLLLALALQQERPTDAVAAAYAMLDSKQQPPVETVAKVLGSAIAAWEENDEAEVQSHLEAAVELATQHGYL